MSRSSSARRNGGGAGRPIVSRRSFDGNEEAQKFYIEQSIRLIRQYRQYGVHIDGMSKELVGQGVLSVRTDIANLIREIGKKHPVELEFLLAAERFTLIVQQVHEIVAITPEGISPLDTDSRLLFLLDRSLYLSDYMRNSLLNIHRLPELAGVGPKFNDPRVISLELKTMLDNFYAETIMFGVEILPHIADSQRGVQVGNNRVGYAILKLIPQSIIEHLKSRQRFAKNPPLSLLQDENRAVLVVEVYENRKRELELGLPGHEIGASPFMIADNSAYNQCAARSVLTQAGFGISKFLRSSVSGDNLGHTIPSL